MNVDKDAVFGKWLVLEPYDQTGPASTRRWRCRCSCGSYGLVRANELKRGNSQHCRKCGAKASALTRTILIDGCASFHHPLHPTWIGMRQRCNNPNNKDYKYYGALGIKVEPRWTSFALFVEDVGLPPTPEHTLDRIDPYGHYEKSNMRWATATQQRNNRRK